MQFNAELKLYNLLCKDFKVVFDVGCRDDLDYFEIHPNCEYHLFEPNVEALSSIKNKLLKYPNHSIKLNEYGLSDKEENGAMYYKNTQSFVPHWQGISKYSGEVYDIKTLDWYVDKNNIKSIDFIKTDCEELDDKVIYGGEKTIIDTNKVTYIQIELPKGYENLINKLNNFDWYMMIDEVWLLALNNINSGPDRIDIDFNISLIKIDELIVKFLNEKVFPTGNGGNILGINKTKKTKSLNDILFKVL